MFKIGDTLVCTETSAVELSVNSITTGDEYVVTGLWEEGVRIVNDDGEEAGVCDYRFKLKEEAKVEKKECLFKVGQIVWDLRNGRGIVEEIINDELYPVKVKFDLKDSGGYDVIDYYMMDGRYAKTQTLRSLYFSEPKIEAATEPVFEPVLEKGDVVVMVDKNSRHKRYVIKVHKEDVEWVKTDCGAMFNKELFDFYKVGEKIEFN